MNIYSLILSDDKSAASLELSTEIVLAITIPVTFVITALFTYILTSLYYKHLMINFIKRSKADLKRIVAQKDSPHANIKVDPACTDAIKMDANPAYRTKADTTIKMDTNTAYAVINIAT